MKSTKTKRTGLNSLRFLLYLNYDNIMQLNVWCTKSKIKKVYMKLFMLQTDKKSQISVLHKTYLDNHENNYMRLLYCY